MGRGSAASPGARVSVAVVTRGSARRGPDPARIRQLAFLRSALCVAGDRIFDDERIGILPRHRSVEPCRPRLPHELLAYVVPADAPDGELAFATAGAEIGGGDALAI